jgi:hypothetical protein
VSGLKHSLRLARVGLAKPDHFRNAIPIPRFELLRALLTAAVFRNLQTVIHGL